MSTSDPPTDERIVRHDSYELAAQLTTTERGTTVCTIYPKHGEADAQMTTWISAKEGSFVNVSDYR